MIKVEHSSGIPVGVYTVFYYRLIAGELVREAGYDRERYDGEVRRLKVGPNEAAQAICQNSPGGLWVFGSQKVKAVWDQWPEGE